MRLGCDVARIDPPRQAGAQGGVETAEGQYLTARQILYNGDSSHLKSGGAGRACARAVGGGPRTGHSQSAMTFSFNALAEGPSLGLHNVFFSRDYPAEFRDVFKKARIPLNPTLYIFAPDAMESSDARSAGPGRYFCLVNAPANGDSHHYTEEDIDRCQTRAFQHLRACGLKLLPTPGEMETSTPTDFAARYPGTGGALFGKAIHGWRASFLRQGIRTRAAAFTARGQRAPGFRRADGRPLGTDGRPDDPAGPGFSRPVPAGGYAWWYVDALSDDGRYGLTMIAFVGSVFSPYYRRTGRTAPEDHCSINVALYGGRKGRWAMTERGQRSLDRSETTLSLGPSALEWNGTSLVATIDERTTPFPRPLRGTIRGRDGRPQRERVFH